MLLEVIGSNLEDVKKINNSNANRIELCSSMEHDGLTPSISFLKEAIQLTNKKIMVMLRNHHDNFQITNKQIKELVDFIEKTKEMFFEGYVFGAITPEKEIDKKALEMICSSLENTTKTITFHKAFDSVNDKEESIEYLSKIKRIKNILTTGGIKGFFKNINLLKKINEKHPEKILIGGGVTLENIDFLLKNKFFNIHVGKAIRKNNSWQTSIDVNKIQILEKKMINFRS